MTREKKETQPASGVTRRDFVQIGGLSTLALGLASCSDSDDDEETTPPPAPVSRRVTPTPNFFPQSVASGDPRPTSIVFWTRLVDPDLPAANHAVRLIIGLDAELTSVLGEISLQAPADRDHVVKAKVGQLTPGTRYYYQFQYTKGGQTLGSKVGRTRTAPSSTSTQPARFAVISCQDYRDRYYNTLAELARRTDVDFVVHLGDYIYETTADSVGKETRSVVFSHPEEAIHLGDRQAARSLSNYRDLYKIYRSDSALQMLHENHPMIAIWDDHEFSDDSWRNSGNYLDGVQSEQDTDRRRNSEQCYAEYMPIEFGLNANGQLASGNEGFYPNTQLFRDFEWGRTLHLVMTDTRTFRPDHTIPEDAFPGTVVIDQATLTAVFASQGVPFAAVRDQFAAYVDLDLPQYAVTKQVLTGVFTQILMSGGLAAGPASARAAATIQGKIAIIVANPMILAYNATNPPQQLPLFLGDNFERGLPYAYLGKTEFFSVLGSRYFIPKPSFDLYTQVRYQASAGESENIYGTSQENWLVDTLAHSTASWRVVAHSVPMNSLVLDLRNYPVPEAFRNQFYVNVDAFDGFGNRRAAVLNQVHQANPNTVFIAGDVHSSFVTQHDHDLVEFTVAAASSSTILDFIREIASRPPFSDVPGIESLVANTNALLLAGHPAHPSGIPKLKYANTDVNGYAIIEATTTHLTAYYNHLPPSLVHTKLYDSPTLGSEFDRLAFRVENGVLTQIR